LLLFVFQIGIPIFLKIILIMKLLFTFLVLILTSLILPAQSPDTSTIIFPKLFDQVGVIARFKKKITAINCGCEYGGRKKQCYLYKMEIDSVFFIQGLEDDKSTLERSIRNAYFLYESEVNPSITASKIIIFSSLSYYDFFSVNKYYPIHTSLKEYTFKKSNSDYLTGIRPCLKASRKDKFFYHLSSKQRKQRYRDNLKVLPKEDHPIWRAIEADIKTN
jgi:hypothetical protein